MRARDVMSSHPILVTSADDDRASLLRLMDDAAVHHLPIVENGRLLGVWVATDDGMLVLLGPDRVEEVLSDADADTGLRALMGDAEVVIVKEAGLPVGVITRSDVLGILRAAIGRRIGRRHPRPTVVRIAGRAGAGKTTLIMRSLAHLGRFDSVVVQANGSEPEPETGSPSVEAGFRELVEPSAHWRAGLDRVVRRLADAELIMLEDRDGTPDLARGIGEDVQVAVVPASEAAFLTADRLADAQAVVLTHLDAVSADDLAGAAASFAERCPGVTVFSVGPPGDDSGLDEWVRWVATQVMRRRG